VLAAGMGELGLHYLDAGPFLPSTAAARSAFADCAGRVFASAAWALDCSGWNPLRASLANPPSLIEPGLLGEEAELGRALAVPPRDGEPDGELAAARYEYRMNAYLLAALSSVAVAAGPDFGRKAVDPRARAELLLQALAGVQRALAATGVPVDEALHAAVSATGRDNAAAVA
jgi:hypothetical protein